MTSDIFISYKWQQYIRSMEIHIVKRSHSRRDILVHGHEYNYDQLNVTPWLQLKYLLMIFMSMYKGGCDYMLLLTTMNTTKTFINSAISLQLLSWVLATAMYIRIKHWVKMNWPAHFLPLYLLDELQNCADLYIHTANGLKSKKNIPEWKRTFRLSKLDTKFVMRVFSSSGPN